MFTPPERKAIALKKFGEGELTLVPGTMSIGELDESKGGSKGLICTIDGSPCKFTLNTFGSKKFQSPFWLIYGKSEPDRDKANLEMSEKVVNAKETLRAFLLDSA